MRATLRFPCEPRYGPRARRAFETLLQASGLDEEARWRFVQAIGEAIGSSIKHARGGASYFEVRIRLRAGVLRVDIETDGAAFDPSNRSPEDTRGFGITVMRQLADGVAFFKNGRLLRLEWNIPAHESVVEPSLSWQA